MRRRETLESDHQFAYQARTVAGGSLLASIVSLCGVGVGTWLLIYSQDFLSLIGVALRDAFVGYAVFSSYMLITGMFGAVVSLTRTAMGLLIFVALLTSNFVCQACIFSYVYLESTEVMNAMNSTILQTTHCRVLDSIVVRLLTRNQTMGVWSMVAVSAILIAFQLLLGVTSVLLRHMITETASYRDCCLPWQHHRSNRTSPSRTTTQRITVTPTTEHPDPQRLWQGGGPSDQGVVNPISHTTQNNSHGRRVKDGGKKSGRRMHYNLSHV